MNSRPPNEVGICAAFSVSKRGYSVPKPTASPAIANVMSVIDTMDTTNMKGLT